MSTGSVGSSNQSTYTPNSTTKPADQAGGQEQAGATTQSAKPEQASGGATTTADNNSVTSGKAALPSAEAQARAKANAAKAIEMFDADKDGNIDMGELDSWVKAAGKGNADESAKFTNANKDSVLSQQEIEDAYNKQYAGEEANAAKAQAQAEDGARQAKADKAADEAIMAADTSGDGKLDKSELDEWSKKANFDANKATKWDKDGSMDVDKSELAAQYKAQYDQEAGIKPAGGAAKAEPAARQETVNKLEKGKAELEAAAEEKKVKESADALAKGAVDKYDTSGDRAIDHDEIVDGYAKEGLTKEQAEEDFAHNNQDGDLKLTEKDISDTLVKDYKEAKAAEKKPEAPPEGGAAKPEGPPKPTPEQVKAEEARKAAENLKAAQEAEAAQKREEQATKERDVAHWSNGILNESTSKENMGIYGANIAKTMPHALTPEHVANMDDNGVREMMGRVSDGELGKVPAATRQAMIDQLDAGWTSGEEYQMMSRLKTSMAMHP